MNNTLVPNARVSYAYAGHTEDNGTIRIISGRGVLIGQDTGGNQLVWLVRVTDSNHHARGTTVSVLPRHAKRLNEK